MTTPADKKALESAKWWLSNACEDHKHSEMYTFAKALVESNNEVERLHSVLRNIEQEVDVVIKMLTQKGDGE